MAPSFIERVRQNALKAAAASSTAQAPPRPPSQPPTSASGPRQQPLRVPESTSASARQTNVPNAPGTSTAPTSSTVSTAATGATNATGVAPGLASSSTTTHRRVPPATTEAQISQARTPADTEPESSSASMLHGFNATGQSVVKQHQSSPVPTRIASGSVHRITGSSSPPSSSAGPAAFMPRDHGQDNSTNIPSTSRHSHQRIKDAADTINSAGPSSLSRQDTGSSPKTTRPSTYTLPENVRPESSVSTVSATYAPGEPVKPSNAAARPTLSLATSGLEPALRSRINGSAVSSTTTLVGEASARNGLSSSKWALPLSDPRIPRAGPPRFGLSASAHATPPQTTTTTPDRPCTPSSTHGRSSSGSISASIVKAIDDSQRLGMPAKRSLSHAIPIVNPQDRRPSTTAPARRVSVRAPMPSDVTTSDHGLQDLSSALPILNVAAASSHDKAPAAVASPPAPPQKATSGIVETPLMTTVAAPSNPPRVPQQPSTLPPRTAITPPSASRHSSIDPQHRAVALADSSVDLQPTSPSEPTRIAVDGASSVTPSASSTSPAINPASPSTLSAAQSGGNTTASATSSSLPATSSSLPPLTSSMPLPTASTSPPFMAPRRDRIAPRAPASMSTDVQRLPPLTTSIKQGLRVPMNDSSSTTTSSSQDMSSTSAAQPHTAPARSRGLAASTWATPVTPSAPASAVAFPSPLAGSRWSLAVPSTQSATEIAVSTPSSTGATALPAKTTVATSSQDVSILPAKTNDTINATPSTQQFAASNHRGPSGTLSLTTTIAASQDHQSEAAGQSRGGASSLQRTAAINGAKSINTASSTRQSSPISSLMETPQQTPSPAEVPRAPAPSAPSSWFAMATHSPTSGRAGVASATSPQGLRAGRPADPSPASAGNAQATIASSLGTEQRIEVPVGNRYPEIPADLVGVPKAAVVDALRRKDIEIRFLKGQLATVRLQDGAQAQRGPVGGRGAGAVQKYYDSALSKAAVDYPACQGCSVKFHAQWRGLNEGTSLTLRLCCKKCGAVAHDFEREGK